MSKIPIDKFQQVVAGAWSKAQSLWTPLWEKLTYNLAEGILVPVKTISVSIEKGGLAIVYGSRFMSKIKIRGSRYYAVEEGKYLQPERFANTVSLSVDEFKARRIDVTLSIPREWVIIRTVELPSTVKENLVNVIAYELDRLTPLSADNALYDFTILGEKEGKLTIMLWAARNNLVGPYIDSLAKEAINVKRVSVGLSNLGTLSRYMEKDPALVFLTFDRYGYQGGLIVNDSLTAAVGGLFDGEDKTVRPERVVTDLRTLIARAQEQGFSPKLLLYPNGEEPVVAEKGLGVPVQTLKHKDLQERFFSEQIDIPSGATGGMLASLWDRARPLNLLSKGFQVTKKTPITITVILLVIACCLAFVYMMVPLQREEKILQEVDKQINARKEEVRKVESLKKEIDGLSHDIAVIKGFKEAKPMSLVLFKELTSLLPKTVWLTRVRITDTTADIEGYANSATEIISKLEASNQFRKVEFASPTIRDTRLNADRFVIKMELEGIQKPDSESSKDGKKK